MTKTYALTAAFLLIAQAAFCAAPSPKPAAANTTKARSAAPRVMAGDYLKAHGDMDVAYDAKDKRFYSVLYAKTHGMHDKGGDPLTAQRLSSLPKDAAMSRAMHGRM